MNEYFVTEGNDRKILRVTKEVRDILEILEIYRLIFKRPWDKEPWKLQSEYSFFKCITIDGSDLEDSLMIYSDQPFEFLEFPDDKTALLWFKLEY